MSNYSSYVSVVSAPLVLPMCLLQTWIYFHRLLYLAANSMSTLGLTFAIFQLSLYLWRYVSLCYSNLASILKSRISILCLTSRFQVSHIFPFFSFTIFFLSHSPIHVLEKKQTTPTTKEKLSWFHFKCYTCQEDTENKIPLSNCRIFYNHKFTHSHHSLGELSMYYYSIKEKSHRAKKFSLQLPLSILMF